MTQTSDLPLSGLPNLVWDSSSITKEATIPTCCVVMEIPFLAACLSQSKGAGVLHY